MTEDNRNIETSMPQPTFDDLASQITRVSDAMQAQAAHAVNLLLTSRNWIIGYYIVEFEQKGSDRAQYGDELLKKLSQRIGKKGLSSRRLYEFRLLYLTYPCLNKAITDYLSQSSSKNILQSLTAKSQLIKSEDNIKLRSLTAKSAENTSPEAWQTAPDQLFHRLSATHLVLLCSISEPLKRAFYEQETIRGSWTVRELDRQISSQYYERSALSKDKMALQQYVQNDVARLQPSHILRDPLTLEFLDIPKTEVYTESKLESAILDKLQQFLLELGQGFCFEARQKRVLIDHDYLKADLIFYHRILHCHVIIDLKIDRFHHEYASQLNTYKNYYKHEVMQEGDNPPIGLLLCSDYGETMVKYATEGLDDVYVAKYMLQLPSEETIRQYLIENQ